MITIPVVSSSGAQSTVSLADPVVTGQQAAWSSADIGALSTPGAGSTSVSAVGVFTISGGGADVWEPRDDCRLVYQPLHGDGQIIARVVSQSNTDPWAKAGLIIKQSAAFDAPCALLAMTPENGVNFQHSFNVNIDGPNPTLPCWFKLVRAGNVITGSVSVNGSSWTTVGSIAGVVVGDAVIGMFVSAHNINALCTAIFDDVSVVSSGVPLPPPSGVTFRPIDGGPNFYADHGHTYAHNAGWDDPNFFPIGVWLGQMLSQSDANRWKDLGLNTGFIIVGNTGSAALMRSNGLHLIVNPDVAQQGPVGNFGALGSETVGALLSDEPSSTAQWQNPIRTIPNSVGDGRFYWLNFHAEWGAYMGDVGGMPIDQVMSTSLPSPNGTPRHVDVTSADFYWFCANDAKGHEVAGDIYNLGRSLTDSEMRHGHNYGYAVDKLRTRIKTSVPLAQMPENGGPYGQNTASTCIKPAELNAAVWGSIIHGARMICYFNQTFGSPFSYDVLATTSFYGQVQPGQTESIYSQTKKTNALVKQLAPVINSPFADNFVTCDLPLGVFSGIDMMAKHKDGVFYVFALNRSAAASTATFTLNGVSGGTATVINENRTIPINAGKFTDTFADRHTVHIYQIGSTF